MTWRVRRAWLAPLIVALAAIALAQGSTNAGNDVSVAQATVQGQQQQVLVTSKGMTLYYSDKDTPDKSNCSGSCAQNWKPYTISGKSVNVGSGAAGATAGSAAGNASGSASGGAAGGATGTTGGSAGGATGGTAGGSAGGAAGAMGAGSLKSSDFSTISSNGKNQVVYKGHPLYTYTKDTKPGDAKGAGQSSFHVATPSTPAASGAAGGAAGGTSGGTSGGSGGSSGSTGSGS